MLQFSKEMLTREPSIPAPEGSSGCRDAFAWTASRRRNTDADRPNLWSPAPMSYTTGWPAWTNNQWKFHENASSLQRFWGTVWSFSHVDLDARIDAGWRMRCSKLPPFVQH